MAAETPSPPPSSPPPPPPQPQPPSSSHYWCYHCDKSVSVDSLPGQPDDLLCNECKFGFVESFLPPPPSSSTTTTNTTFENNFLGNIADVTPLGSQFIEVLRLLSQVARDDDVPSPPSPPPPPSPPSDDFLRIEIDAWDHHHNNLDNRNHNEDHDDDEDEEEDEDEEDEVRSVEIEGESDEEEREEDIRRRRRDVLRLRLRDFANRARSEGRNRILDWAEILMGLEDNSIEFRFELPENMTITNDRYIGNPGDYVDAAEYEALLQNLADAEGRRGAPPASKEAVQGLKVVEIKTLDESYVCAICKDGVNVGDVVKEMPCGHGYHGDCIVPWLAARNSCPVCRFELPTDDADYEEERKKKTFPGSSSSGGGGNVV